MQQVEFGWLDQHFDLAGDEITVTPLHNHAEAVDWAKKNLKFGSRFMHHPVHPVSEKLNRFELPPTHLLTYPGSGSSRDLDELIVSVLGFLLGMRLAADGIGHLHPTPHSAGELVLFRPDKHEISRVLNETVKLSRHGPSACRSLFASIHWYLTAQTYIHPHDRFSWLHTTLDAAFHASILIQPHHTPPKSMPHGKRIEWLSSTYGSPLHPSFANSDGPAGALVFERNQLIHEARFCGEPIGYAYSSLQHELIHGLAFFCSQLILGLLNVDCKFRREVWDYQIHGLDLDS